MWDGLCFARARTDSEPMPAVPAGGVLVMRVVGVDGLMGRMLAACDEDDFA